MPASPAAGSVSDPSPPTGLDELPGWLESERLVIRVARPGDGPMLRAAVVESHAELTPWLEWVTPLPTPVAMETACRRGQARFLLNEDLMAFFVLKDGGVLVGGGGLHRVDWALRHFEVGYWGRTGWTGRGLVTEGVRTLAEHALLALRANRVHLTTDARNVASARLAERAGFVLEGTLRNERLDVQGRLRDTRVYARTPARPPTPDGGSPPARAG